MVVISAHPIPGNEWSVGQVIDDLHRRGAEVVHSGAEAVHVSGHARQGELRTLISVTEPECFVPVHGEFRHMVHHARLALSMGIDPAKVLLCEDGDVIQLDAKGISRDGKVPGATSTSTARWGTSSTGCSVTERSSPRRALSWPW